MARRTTTATAGFYGGGPADGERRPVEEGSDLALVAEPLSPDAAGGPALERLHVYERAADGRFVYAGVEECEAAPPEPAHDDGHALGLAALGHERGPSGALILFVIGLVTVVMYCFATYV